MGMPRYIYKKLMLLFYIASPFLFFLHCLSVLSMSFKLTTEVYEIANILDVVLSSAPAVVEPAAGEDLHHP